MNRQEIAAKIPAFEGLIFATAQIIKETPRTPPVEIDIDDIRQRLRIKVWKGLEGYDRHRDPGAKKRHPQALERFVYQCVVNEKRDILKQVRRGDQYIEDWVGVPLPGGRVGKLATENNPFELRYFSQSEEQVFAEVEEEPLQLPSTLTTLERRVVGLLYESYQQTEVRQQLGLSVRAIDSLMRSIRMKLADYKPAASERRANKNDHGGSCPESVQYSPPRVPQSRWPDQTPPLRAPSQPVAA